MRSCGPSMLYDGAVDDGPQRAIGKRPLGGEDAVLKRGSVGLPLGADQEIGEAALDLGDAADGLGVARRDAVPDAPDVLPGFVADAVEERELQIVGLVLVPAVADVDHVAGLEPLAAADRGDERVLPIAPAQVVPIEHFVGFGIAFGLEGEGVAGGVAGDAEAAGDAVIGIAVDAIRADFRQQSGDGFGEGARLRRGCPGPRACSGRGRGRGGGAGRPPSS